MADTVPIDLDDLKRLALCARTTGKEWAFVDVALQWAKGADAEIRRLRAKLEALDIEP